MGIVLNISESSMQKKANYEIYRLEFPDKRFYIGCTSLGVFKRVSDHYSASKQEKLNSRLYKAIRKFGMGNIKVETIDFANDKTKAFELEKKYVALYNSKKNGYNSTTGGTLGTKKYVSDEARRIISEAQKRRYECPEQREMVSKRIKRFVRDNPKGFEKLVKKRNAILRTEQHREKMSKIMKELHKNKPEIREKWKSKMEDYYSNEQNRIARSKENGGRPVEVYRDGIHVATFPTLTEVSRTLGLSLGNIGLVLKGKRAHTGGYTFKRGEWNDDIKIFNNISSSV